MFYWPFLCERHLHIQGVICRNRPVVLNLQAVGCTKNISRPTVEYFQRDGLWCLGVDLHGEKCRSSIALVPVYVSAQPIIQSKLPTEV